MALAAAPLARSWQRSAPEDERLARRQRLVIAQHEIGHLPQGIEMGDVVDRELGKVKPDLSGDYRRLLTRLLRGPGAGPVWSTRQEGAPRK